MFTLAMVLASMAGAPDTPDIFEHAGSPELLARKQSQFRIPKPPVPNVPGIVNSVRGDAGSSSQGDTNGYMQDIMLLSRGIDIAEEREAVIERQAQEYRAAVDRLASDHYSSVPAQVRQSREVQMKRYFEMAASRVDDEIAWARQRFSRNAGTNPKMPVLAYNQVYAKALAMDAAVKLFPGQANFAEAKAKTDAWMARIGGRDNAANAFASEAAEVARSVTMPPATNNSASLKQAFRTGWATSGIRWEVLAIHPVGGWRDKRENGRLVGQVHDAWIAAKNPNDPNHCNLYDFTILKDRSGSVRRNSHSTKRIACENVPG